MDGDGATVFFSLDAIGWHRLTEQATAAQTSRFLVAGFPIGTWDEPRDLITVVNHAAFIKMPRSSLEMLLMADSYQFFPYQGGQSHVCVLDNSCKC